MMAAWVLLQLAYELFRGLPAGLWCLAPWAAR